MRLSKVGSLVDHASHEQQGTGEEVLAILREILKDGIVEEFLVGIEQRSLLLKVADETVEESSIDDCIIVAAKES